MFSRFRRDFANETMMAKGVTIVVASSTTMVSQQTGIHSEASVIITSCSDKRSKKICSRERRTSYKCMRVRLSHKDVRKIPRAKGSSLPRSPPLGFLLMSHCCRFLSLNLAPVGRRSIHKICTTWDASNRGTLKEISSTYAKIISFVPFCSLDVKSSANLAQATTL